MGNDAPRKKPVSGFVIKRLDVKAWVAIVGILLAGSAAAYSLLGGFFESKDDAASHKEDFVKHEKDYATHKAVNDERHKTQEKQNAKMDRTYDNVLKIGEKLKVRRLRRTEEEDHE